MNYSKAAKRANKKAARDEFALAETPKRESAGQKALGRGKRSA
jgi:hypothetical protein